MTNLNADEYGLRPFVLKAIYVDQKIEELEKEWRRLRDIQATVYRGLRDRLDHFRPGTRFALKWNDSNYLIYNYDSRPEGLRAYITKEKP